LEGSWDCVGSIDDLFLMNDISNAFYRDPVTGRVINPCIRHYEHRGISIDPAYFGDDKTVMYGWENDLAKRCLSYGKQDPMYTVGQALSLESEMKATCVFGVDDTGGYGSGVVSALKQHYKEGYEEHKRVVPVVFSQREGIEECFYNMRAKLYWEAAEEVKARRCPIPELDIELHGELCAIKYQRKGGKIFIEDKDAIKKRLGKSPDRADAWVIGRYIMRMQSSGLISIPQYWVDQKPVWQQIREEKHREREYQDQEQDLFIA
jgi:hypothetical protein